MTLDIATPLQFDDCDNYGHAFQIHDGIRQVALVEVCADLEGSPGHHYPKAEARGRAYARLFTAAPGLLEIAKRHRHLLAELHAGNAYSKEHLWHALTETELALSKAGAP
jgi:hypothetical protein